VADPTHRRYFTEGTFSYLNARHGKWQVFGSSYGFRPFHVLKSRKLAGELEVLMRPCKGQRAARPARPSRSGRRPRVCFLSHNQPGAGGGENAMHQVANGLSREGFEVTAIFNATPFIHRIPVEEPSDALYEVQWVEGADLESFHAAATRAVTERAGQFDVCMPLWRASSPGLMRACRRHGLGAGLWCQNVQYAPERTNDSVFRLADYVVTVTPFGKLMLSQRFDRTEEVYVIPNACSGRFFDACVDREDERMERFVFFGRLADEQKGLGTLCNALAVVAQQRTDWRLDVIGDGPDADRMRSRIGTLGLGERVRFLGWKKPRELAPLLAAYDLCILPSNFEGCSLALIEAMAVGVPIITTKVGGNPWLITDSKHGRVIAPARPRLLAQTILWACEHPAEMHLMARFAHKKALKRYHWGRVVSDYCKLFSRIELPARGGESARKAG
jgi:glycosyltransferase involved in cell wall biosynthesis